MEKTFCFVVQWRQVVNDTTLASVVSPTMIHSRGLQNFGFCLLIWICLFIQGTAASAPIDVPLITYYDYPPFTLQNASKSLTQELAEYLSQASNGRFHFSVKVIPKGRLDVMMEKPDWKGVIAWINPKFVHDEAKTRYLWTAAIMNEIDLVASNKEAPHDYKGPESLRGLKLGAVLNQRYADVEDMIAKGALIRTNARSQENVLNMLIHRRVDVAFVSKSTLSWFRIHLKGFEQKVGFSPVPRNTFTRHVMLSRTLPPDVVDYVTKTTNGLGSQAQWQDIMNRFHIKDQIP
ncbi:MAG TPA: hypothetical protein VE954_03460 [Oligoflexus sp.]|uniref:hypothetical protein n=1 Tax=Oligoflexus sp. TaxID=1971216 RepID=UPI002D63DB54|nr:hypothetical protein [Oligoflexus sp.]HYX32144.1 hypothetical protein [Oligoflexus sp.]